MSTPSVVNRSARTAKPAWNEPDRPGLPITGPTGSMINSNTQKDPAMLSNTPRSCIANSETPHGTNVMWLDHLIRWRLAWPADPGEARPHHLRRAVHLPGDSATA